MAAVERYVIVSKDVANKTIVDGPFAWNGKSELAIGDSMAMAMRLSTALVNGYTFLRPTNMSTDDVAEETLRGKARNALVANAAYLAGAKDSSAIAQQVAALTRQMNVIIRLAVGELNSTDGT